MQLNPAHQEKSHKTPFKDFFGCGCPWCPWSQRPLLDEAFLAAHQPALLRTRCPPPPLTTAPANDRTSPVAPEPPRLFEVQRFDSHHQPRPKPRTRGDGRRTEDGQDGKTGFAIAGRWERWDGVGPVEIRFLCPGLADGTNPKMSLRWRSIYTDLGVTCAIYPETTLYRVSGTPVCPPPDACLFMSPVSLAH